ncbi:MAG: 3-deoxy-7-phosphoheptulonate synthase [bacterium]|nr:3-deoxy-7-phosphoheptulonate synthase [bacterium]
MNTVFNVNVESFKKLISPKEIQNRLPLSEASRNTVLDGRKSIQNILNRQDKRKLIIVGPCSIHDFEAAKEYAAKLVNLAKEVESRLVIVMRTYFEKPRTTVGWKGYINDPFLDNSMNINQGLLLSRKLLGEITEMGLPVATEALDPIVPQYLADLISWTAIGARTTESQTHREMASGLSSPVGFKNNTDGNITVAVNALKSAGRSHCFLGIDSEGTTAIVETKGNANCHLILRGGTNGPNYDSVNVAMATAALKNAGLNSAIVVDCSHDNCHKDFRLQSVVLDDCISQILNGNDGLIGFMIESHLHEGNQPISAALKPGISITDGCLDWDSTSKIIINAFNRLI